MKRYLILILFSCGYFLLQAQPVIKTKKYPSLLWEITGNGLKKPSWLIGTMHVSSKMAFNLPDSFYYALRSADVVALETNPETWQEDMSRYDFSEEMYTASGGLYGKYTAVPDDYLSINTLKFYRYDKKIERALYSNPSAINNLLYRSYGNESSDFEEDTYLDMYIFQCGRKWGKRIAGVENYDESMQLMAEAYKDAAKDKTNKERSYGDWDKDYSTEKLQEAYRRGNLDLLDTINKYNSFSAAFDEKFLYRRNEIQVLSIDSILRSGSRLFVGVGAAHLPGDRGVIEMLRSKGYKLRPVKMGERASREKELVDKIRVPVTFRTDTAADALFKVDIPGKFYQFGDDAALDQRQYADMANGSYYMVTRIMTNAWMWNHNVTDVYRVVDSLLYENIPGKIISKTPVSKNGYKGFDVVNRTRRGDIQRYQIYITPFEIIFFKMSGNGDYVKNGTEASRFFSSITFRDYGNGNGTAAWKKYSPPWGGFTVELPHAPYLGNDGSWIFDAMDKTGNNQFRIIKTDIHNFHFAEEDSFDLGLMEESFMASEFISSSLERKQGSWKGYPVLDGRYRDKWGYTYTARFIIQGPHYYTLLARSMEENEAVRRFMNSFELVAFVYGEPAAVKDTALYFTVTTPFYPVEKKIRLDIPRYSWLGATDEDDESEEDLLETGLFRNKVIHNDSTGEKIYVSFFRPSRYHYIPDSATFEKRSRASIFTDSSFVYRVQKKWGLTDNSRIWETVVTDTGSSRTLWTKMIYKDGTGFTLATQSDSITAASPFVKNFFETFMPADTLKGMNPFVKKSALFFEDLGSSDSTLRNQAIKYIRHIQLDSTDFIPLKQAIASLRWEEKKYMDTKKALLNKLGDIRTKVSADFLKAQYYALDDTLQLQYAVLENLLQHRTAYAFGLFRDIISTEPPVADFKGRDFTDFSTDRYYDSHQVKNGSFRDELFDSLKLTRTILPDLLPLLNLDDYKKTIMELLADMADSNLVYPKEYENYFSKFLLEAKQELKKQSVAEKKKSIARAEENKTDKKKPSYLREDDTDYGNSGLHLYARLLLPFSGWRSEVMPVIQQMLQSADKRLKYNTFILLLRKNRPYPDTLLSYFASLNEYRYELYTELSDMNKLHLFPAQYNNHTELGHSAILYSGFYTKPDTMVFLKRMHASHLGKKGFMYFFKFKEKKDDLTWKLACAGLLPEDSTKFEFEKAGKSQFERIRFDYLPGKKLYDFTGYTDIKLRDNEPLEVQLGKALKKIMYARRHSAKEFYKDEEDKTITDDD